MIRPIDIAWLAGILEGEGCFTPHRKGQGGPRIALRMSDEDIVRRAGILLKSNVTGPHYIKNKPNRKPYWSLDLGRQADSIGWMLTIYSVMGIRRQEKIRQIVLAWRKVRSGHWSRYRNKCKRGHVYDSLQIRQGKVIGRDCSVCRRQRRDKYNHHLTSPAHTSFR